MLTMSVFLLIGLVLMRSSGNIPNDIGRMFFFLASVFWSALVFWLFFTVVLQ